MLESEIRIEVIEQFSLLKEQLSKLEESICNNDSEYECWFKPPEMLNNENKNYRSGAGKFLNQLEFLDKQLPKEILIGIGLFACSKNTYELIKKVNETKNNFKKAMVSLKAYKINLKDQYLNEQFENILKNRPNSLRNTLQKIGLARLHLKQCYRMIPILDSRPKKVSWTWANTRSIKRIDVATAKSMLLKHKNDAGIHHQLNKLEKINLNEPLAIVQELAPHMRANIVMENSDGDKRFMIKGSMPIFYLDESKSSLPQFILPKDKKEKDSNRQIRSDVKLDPEPFLPAIRVHKYLNKEIIYA